MELHEAVQKPEEEFSTWMDKQDFDYQRKQSAVMDYLNEHIDYDKLNEIVDENKSFGVVEVEKLTEKLGFSTGSTKSTVVKNHVERYTERLK